MKKSDMIKKLEKIKKLKLAGVIICIIVIFNASCVTPHGALRTHLFISGHPIIAFITAINDDELHNRVDSEFLKTKNAHCYELGIPPYHEATGTSEQSYIVKKRGFFYFAKYYGEA
ncbi:hypothetical protein [Clostridium sp.]|uniref:hypothetical protein n=1 Tax=Clostridium sp. TaxID=1506 RepID=UPI003D6CC6CD